MVKNLPKQKSLQNGQAVLVILLVISVILVVGLSVVSRSITDVKISQQSQESARALWVAQAGLERAIKANSSNTINDTLNEINYSVARTDLGLGTNFVYPNKVEANEPATLWLVEHNTDGSLVNPLSSAISTLNFYWGEGNSTTALEATVIYKAGTDYQTVRYVYAPTAGLAGTTHFTQALSGGTLGAQAFSYGSGVITLPAGTPILVKIRLLFNTLPQPVGVSANTTLPLQGHCFESSATVEESGITRKLRQCQLWSTTPPIFDNLVFSGGSI